MSIRALPLAGLVVALAALVAPADEPKKEAAKPKDAQDGPAVQKLKQAEEAYRSAREEAYKELLEAEKKARVALEKAQQEFAKAGANKDARAKAREDMIKAHEDLEHLTRARLRILAPSLGPVLASLPAPKEEMRFGARFTRPGELLAAHLNLEKGRGLVIEKLEKDQTAEKVGLKAYDVLVEINGKSVPTDIEQFRKLLAEIKPDTAVTLVVLRQGKSETIKDVKLPAAQPSRP
jgi:C-terminal processing protease CtpA/Prc